MPRCRKRGKVPKNRRGPLPDRAGGVFFLGEGRQAVGLSDQDRLHDAARRGYGNMQLNYG